MAHTVCDPRSCEPVSQQPLRVNPVKGSWLQSLIGVPKTLSPRYDMSNEKETQRASYCAQWLVCYCVSLVRFDVARGNEFLPTRKFACLKRAKLFGRVEHDFETDIGEFRRRLRITNGGDDGVVNTLLHVSG
jgi:hypothetical protein